MAKIMFATPYTVDRSWSAMFATDNKEPSLTQQSDANDTDINVIVERYTKTGMLPQLQLEKLYGDFTAVGNYRDAMELLKAAREEFEEIPAEIRKQFGNDPQAFITFAQNPENIPKLREMGLAPPEHIKPATLDDATTTLREIRDTLKPKENDNGKSKTS